MHIKISAIRKPTFVRFKGKVGIIFRKQEFCFRDYWQYYFIALADMGPIESLFTYGFYNEGWSKYIVEDAYRLHKKCKYINQSPSGRSARNNRDGLDVEIEVIS